MRIWKKSEKSIFWAMPHQHHLPYCQKIRRTPIVSGYETEAVKSSITKETWGYRWVHSYQVSSQLPYGTKMGKIAAVLGFTDWATTDNKVEIKVVTSFITFYMLEKLSFLSRDANGVSFSGGFMALPQHGCCFTINGSRYVTVVV